MKLDLQCKHEGALGRVDFDLRAWASAVILEVVKSAIAAARRARCVASSCPTAANASTCS